MLAHTSPPLCTSELLVPACPEARGKVVGSAVPLAKCLNVSPFLLMSVEYGARRMPK